MSVIAYDKPVRNFIPGLNATGHVTHKRYRKTSVTFHHNGGRLSLQGILDVWKVRPASAHFQVDGKANIGQYVKINEYAWAAGNTQGNMSSIHIEMANSTLAPEWRVGEATWKEAARLAGWIFARVIGTRPNKSNVKVHHDWKATLCAGPYIDDNYNRLLAEVQKSYEYFTGKRKTDPRPSRPSGGSSSPSSKKKSIGTIAAEVIAGKWGNGDDRFKRLRSAGYNPDEVQGEVNRRLKGYNPRRPAKKTVAQLATEVINGEWGNNPDRSRRLREAGYNPTEVQREVNRRLGIGRSKSVRPTISLLATQVIAGQWGNGVERRRRLTAAGHDADAIQAEVNRRLLG